MRTNSVSLRLNYSSSWFNKIIPGKGYTDNFINAKKQISDYLKNFFNNKTISRILVNSKYRIYFYNKGNVLINVYVYIFKYADKFSILKYNKISKNNLSYISNYLLEMFLIKFLGRVKFILSKDLGNIIKDKYFIFNFILVKKIYFDASLASKYITNKLLNKFKLEKVITDLKKDIITNKDKNGIIVYCSGRFDRKERASSEIYSEGKISLTTIKNKVTYSQSSVILKYGICGIKVWVLN